MDEQRQDVPLDDIPPDLQHAFIAIEDHRFYQHLGIDPIALGRAVVPQRPRAGDAGGRQHADAAARADAVPVEPEDVRPQGRAKRCSRCMIDAQLSKDQILELYLNRIYLSAGVYGVETMSRHLFGKPAKHADAAGVRADRRPGARAVGAVAVVQPRRRRRAQPRRAAAHARGGVHHGGAGAGGAARRGSGSRRIPARPRRAAATRRSSCGSSSAIGSAAIIRPTGRCARRSCRSCRTRPSARSPNGLRRFGEPDLQAALVAIDPRDRRHPRAGRRPRLPAVAVQPRVRAAAGSRDRRSSRCSTPRRSSTGYSPVSRARRAGARSRRRGPTSGRRATPSGETPDDADAARGAASSRTTALRRCCSSGSARAPVLRLASDVGLRDMPDVPSLSLGTGLVTPLDLTAAFAVFPNGGFAVRPRGDRAASSTPTAASRSTTRRTAERVISPQTAFQMVSMLEDVIDRGTGAAARSAMACGFPSGGKTGTTNDFKDAWFVGFSSSVVVGVWVGFDQPKTIGREAYGARYALPIWSDFMRRARAQRRPPQEFEAPPGLREEQLCRVSYLRPVEGCPVYTEYFKEGRRCPDAAVPDPPGHGEAAGHARVARIPQRPGAEAERDLPMKALRLDQGAGAFRRIRSSSASYRGSSRTMS